MAVSVASLRTFVAVAEAGNITDAAHALGRTPSAVSMTLKQLEDHLGRPLFQGDRKSRLTALGIYVLEMARREVAHFTQTVGSIESFARNEIGQIYVACVPSFATHVMPGVLKTFLPQWPGIEIDLRDMDSQTVRRFVEQGRVEIGVASVPEGKLGPNVVPLMADRLGVVCRADHPLTALDGPLTWSDLAGETFIANGLCSLVSGPEMATILEHSTLMVRNTTSIMALVAAGVGITILPQLSVPDESDATCFLPLDGLNNMRPLHILTRPNSTLSPAAEVFVGALQAAVKEKWWRQTGQAA